MIIEVASMERASQLRNDAISHGKGALIIGPDQVGDIRHLLEKAIFRDLFIPGTQADSVNWKPDPQIILVGVGANRLEEIEKVCPGFTKKLGPVMKDKAS